MGQTWLMKFSRPRIAVIIAAILGIPAILGGIGNVSTVVDMFAWMSPQARAFVTAEANWRYAATFAFLWLAIELNRDVEVRLRAQNEAKSNYERAWSFEPEFRQAMENLKAHRESLRTQSDIIDCRCTEISEAIDSLRLELQDEITTMQKNLDGARSYWGQEFGESRAMEQRRFSASFDPFQASMWGEIEKLRNESKGLNMELGSRIAMLERVARSES